MITAVNSNNVEKYKALFEEATELLNGFERVQTFDIDKKDSYYKKNEDNEFELITIESLDKFAQILSSGKKVYIATEGGANADFVKQGSKITSLEEYFAWIEELGQKNKRYTKLPLDEPHFIINPETRAIIIPSEFKKNGISVQGDELSEVVYFEVDRFYDYKDLNTSNIYIQWELPKGSNGPEVGVSTEHIRDIESKPGKLIFGWALSNKITKNAGALKFSVRFYDEMEDVNNKKILGYSLSTLTASVNILPSIGIDITSIKEEQIDRCSDNLIQRLENAQVVGGVAAAQPEYVEYDLDQLEYDLDDNEEVVLRVMAKSKDTGTISYKWKKISIDADNKATNEIKSMTSEFNMVEIDEEEYDALPFGSVGIYALNGEKYDLITSKPDAETLKNMKLYYKVSVCKVPNEKDEKVVGYYYAIASNRVSNSVNEKESKKAFFPYPTDVAIATDVADKYILGKEPADSVLTVGLAEAADTEKCTFTYQWYKNNNYVLDFNEEEASWDKIEENGTGKTYKPENPGRYKVIVTKTRNKENTDTTSSICRVTNMPIAPVVEADIDILGSAEIDSREHEGFKIIVQNKDTINYDNFRIKWFYRDDDKNLTTELLTVQDVLTFNPMHHQDMIKEALGLGENDNIDGAYLAEVTNEFNGEVASSEQVRFIML